jgi:hypothetical protein
MVALDAPGEPLGYGGSVHLPPATRLVAALGRFCKDFLAALPGWGDERGGRRRRFGGARPFPRSRPLFSLGLVPLACSASPSRAVSRGTVAALYGSTLGRSATSGLGARCRALASSAASWGRCRASRTTVALGSAFVTRAVSRGSTARDPTSALRHPRGGSLRRAAPQVSARCWLFRRATRATGALERGARPGTRAIGKTRSLCPSHGLRSPFRFAGRSC